MTHAFLEGVYQLHNTTLASITSSSLTISPFPNLTLNLTLTKVLSLKLQLFMNSQVLFAALDSDPAPALQADLKRARRMFEAAIDAHGDEDWRLWALYVAFARAAGGAAGDVQWRATKALRDPEPFRAAMQAGGGAGL